MHRQEDQRFYQLLAHGSWACAGAVLLLVRPAIHEYMPTVRVFNEAASEIAVLPGPERTAIENAIIKLNELGETLGYPPTSQVKGTALRESRPRRGRSPWRAQYKRVGAEVFVIAAASSEAVHDPRAFRRAIAIAQQRLDSLERPS